MGGTCATALAGAMLEDSVLVVMWGDSVLSGPVISAASEDKEDDIDISYTPNTGGQTRATSRQYQGWGPGIMRWRELEMSSKH